MIEVGGTRVLCAASVEEAQPPHLKGTEEGWITAEYAMLPRSTHTRKQRDSTRGRIDGRTHEIQRLIGRSLRAAIDLSRLGARTIYVDCDVIQADGGTRTAAITGSYVALYQALQTLMGRGLFTIFLAIGLTQWAGLARLVRGQLNLPLRDTEAGFKFFARDRILRRDRDMRCRRQDMFMHHDDAEGPGRHRPAHRLDGPGLRQGHLTIITLGSQVDSAGTKVSSSMAAPRKSMRPPRRCVSTGVLTRIMNSASAASGRLM